MSLVHSRLSSGLYVAETATDYMSVAQALRDHDRQLRLVPQGVDRDGRPIYKVLLDRGDDRPAETVLVWMDEQMQEALPLSHRIVDEVKRLDRNSRADRVSDDDHNRKLAERAQEQLHEELVGVGLEEAARTRRSPALHRGIHLRRSRHKRGGRPGR